MDKIETVESMREYIEILTSRLEVFRNETSRLNEQLRLTKTENQSLHETIRILRQQLAWKDVEKLLKKGSDLRN